MTETNEATTTEEPTVSTDVGGDEFELRETLYKVALGLFTLLAVVAVLQLYLSVGRLSTRSSLGSTGRCSGRRSIWSCCWPRESASRGRSGS